MGLFVSFEGGEGTGKSTQARLLLERLAAQGYEAVDVREPGGTGLGSHLREYLKATDLPLTAQAELFLFVAARSELVRRVIRPALDAGKVVVADRYADSTTVYQGHGRRLPLRRVRSANSLATGGLWPDLTVLLDLPPEMGLDRARLTPLDRRNAGRPEDKDSRRFEEAGLAFHRRVRDGYLKLVSREPARWLALDAAQPVEALADQVWERVAGLLAGVAVLRAKARLPGL